jgi:uncharacterized lipoprotein YajG
MNRKLLMAAAAAAALSGCALTTDRISLEYTPQAGVAPIAGANNVAVSVQVSDHRPDKTKVSSKKNGFGMEMAPIVASEDVAVTIRRAIDVELRARGFQLADGARVKLAAEVTRFWNDHKIGFFAGDAVADLNMTVSVRSKGGEQVYARQISAQGIEANTQLATGDNAKLALDRSLASALKTLFDDRAFLAALLAP